MQTLIESMLALCAGGAIGWSLGLIRNPGLRLAYLLACLMVIQIVCPLLFSAGMQWWVSGGLLAGYGWTLYRERQNRGLKRL